MKKVVITVSLMLMVIILSACSSIPDGTETTSTATNETSQTASESTTKKPQATETRITIRPFPQRLKIMKRQMNYMKS